MTEILSKTVMILNALSNLLYYDVLNDFLNYYVQCLVPTYSKIVCYQKQPSGGHSGGHLESSASMGVSQYSPS